MCLRVGMLVTKYKNFIFNQHLEKLFSIAAVIAFNKVGKLNSTHFGTKRAGQRHNIGRVKQIAPLLR
jgi:hypothetical protein